MDNSRIVPAAAGGALAAESIGLRRAWRRQSLL